MFLMRYLYKTEIDNSRYNSYGSKEALSQRSILGNTKICKYWFDNQLLILRGENVSYTKINYILQL